MYNYFFKISFCFLSCFSFFSCNVQKENAKTSNEVELILPNETHFKNMRQLTFGGDNAEAYWSYDSKKLVFQKSYPKENIPCDQIYYGDASKSNVAFKPLAVSNGKGRTTCSYFLKGDEEIIYASTHDYNDECPPVPDREKIGKYVWAIYQDFELYIKNIKTGKERRLTNNNYYDAEATVSPDGKKIVYTSTENGDLDLYVMDIDGKNKIQVTNQLGYDGGAFFSPDGKQLVFRASRPKGEEAEVYKKLLSENMVTPSDMELYIVDIDGKNLKQITQIGKANWAPYWHPSGKKIIFSSNHQSQRGFPFNLYMIDIDGKNLERITNSDQFDAFAMFSPDGKKIVFCSNRNNGGGRDTNIFVADWVE